MPTIDDEIAFHLSKEGWYLGDTKINIVEESLIELGVDVNHVHFASTSDWGSVINGEITLNRAVVHACSLPQIALITLHEHYHHVLGHKGLNDGNNYRREYECDILALKHMIKSEQYTKRELYNAIKVFGDVISEGRSGTHPSSIERYNALFQYLGRFLK
jgi:hypothetical protein